MAKSNRTELRFSPAFRLDPAISLLCAAGLYIALSSTPAFADLLIYEPFDYADGAAIIGSQNLYSPGSPTWARAGTATSPTHHASSPSLTAPSGFPGSVGNAGVTLGGPTGGDFTEYARLGLGATYGANQTLYYSLLLNVPDTTGMTVPNSNLNANNDGIIAFNNATGASGTRPSTWAGELTMRLGSAANTFNLGIRGSTTAAGTTFWTSDLTPGSTYLVVVGFTEGATPGTGGLSSLWLNPNSATFGAATPPTADGSTVGTYSSSGTSDHTDSIILGAGIAAGADPSQTYVDEIRVGTTWSDVTAVPEPSTAVLAGFGALGLLSWYRARRR
jgi:hypothetical protein